MTGGGSETYKVITNVMAGTRAHSPCRPRLSRARFGLPSHRRCPGTHLPGRVADGAG